jgi:hypothetical protein
MLEAESWHVVMVVFRHAIYGIDLLRNLEWALDLQNSSKNCHTTAP